MSERSRGISASAYSRDIEEINDLHAANKDL
jgi:hypothetical protein